MKKSYLITVRAYAPYERRFEYRVDGVWKMTKAVGSALRSFKQEDHIKGKKTLGKVFIEVEQF